MKQSFLKGTLILFFSGLINRLLGFVPRIVLPRVIGAEGVGLFQLSYPFLILLLTIISGGLPVAVAKMVAEAEQRGDALETRRILRIALRSVFVLSVICAALCLSLAQWMSIHLFRDERVYYTFLATVPMLFIVGTASVLRGYFQGKHNMLPTALSQVVETLVRLGAVVSLAYVCYPYGLEWAAAGAMGGVVLGECSGLLYLLWCRWRERRLNEQNEHATFMNIDTEKTANTRSGRRMFALALPMTGSKLVASTSYFFESILIIQSLAIAGVSVQQSTALYGILQGMIIPILVLPNALTYSLSLSLIPALSQAYARKDWQMIRTRIQQSLKISLICGIPFAVSMFVFAQPICKLLYANVEIAYMLQMMAPLALFLYVQAPLQAALQALNRSGIALRNTLVAAFLKLALIYILASSPELGINGAMIAINVNILLTTLLHWFSVRKHTGLNTRSLQLPLLALCAAFMVGLSLPAHAISERTDSLLHTAMAMSLAVSCYLCFLFAFRIIRWKQLTTLWHRSAPSSTE